VRRPRVAAVFFDFGGRCSATAGGRAGCGDPRRGLALASDEPGRIGAAYNDAMRDAYQACQDRPYYLHRELFADSWRRFARALGAEPTEEWVNS
jgi:hypothetical protein